MRPVKRIANGIIPALLVLATLEVAALEPPSGIRLETSAAEIFPIGWSRDGKFAYLLMDEPAFRGGYGFRAAIVDARTDQVLWTAYEHSDGLDWDGDGPPLAAAWQRYEPQIRGQLAVFGIERVTSSRVDPLPLVRGTDAYSALVREWRVNPETSPYGNGVVGYTLTFTSRERGAKVIAQRNRIFATDIRVQGYIRSPFENRIVLVVSESGNAYGGTRFTDITIIGAHLDVGFE